MSEWAAKRFWTDVTVVETADGFAVQLDGRNVKTPLKAPLAVPSHAIAEAIADEWRAVEEKIDPSVMPYTRSANAAIDKVTPQFAEVAEMLAAYGGSDLLCYRADAPIELVARQADAWDPLLDWAHATYGARLLPTAGVMPVAQDPKALERLAKPLFDATPFELTALHDLISLSGSLVIGLATAAGHLHHQDAWPLSRVDEDWQEEQWGADDEATQAAEIKAQAFAHAADFFEKLRL